MSFDDVALPGMPEPPPWKLTDAPEFSITGSIELEFDFKANLLDLVRSYLKEFLSCMPEAPFEADFYFEEKVNKFLGELIDNHCEVWERNGKGLTWSPGGHIPSYNWRFQTEQLDALERALIQANVYSADEERARIGARSRR